MAVADTVVFSKIRALTGGRIRLFVSGSAALNEDVARWFDAAGMPIIRVLRRLYVHGVAIQRTEDLATRERLRDQRGHDVPHHVPAVRVRQRDAKPEDARPRRASPPGPPRNPG